MVIFLGAIGATLYFNSANQGNLSGNARVIDADTLIINGQKVRLWGVDAPEWNQTCGQNDWPCGQKATDHMRALVAQGALECTTFGQDKYGRVLATCYVGSKNMAADLVASGYAIATDDYFSQEKAARHEKKNIWSGSFDRPVEWRREHQQNETETPSFFQHVLSRFL